MAFTGIPRELAAWVGSLNASPFALIAILAVIYLLLGMAIDGISMIVLTTSIVLPMVEAAGFDLIWFGIFIVILVEIAQITPPVGFNLFVLQTMSGRDANYVALASLPFFFLMLLAIGVVVAFPQIAIWLPDALLGATRK
jgi:TRAP-type C4-dicarboxylate transport system permease large subunit